MTSPLGIAHARSIIPKGTAKQRLGLHSTPAVATRGVGGPAAGPTRDRRVAPAIGALPRESKRSPIARAPSR